MAFKPAVNRNAIWLVRRNVAGTLPIGRGVRLTGAVGADDIAMVAAPLGADGAISGVIYETSPDDVNAGQMLQAGISNVQIRIGSASVSFGDSLNIQDNTGVWQTAPAGAQNVYYYALQNAAAGALCWAAPVGSRPR